MFSKFVILFSALLLVISMTLALPAPDPVAHPVPQFGFGGGYDQGYGHGGYGGQYGQYGHGGQYGYGGGHYGHHHGGHHGGHYGHGFY